MKIASTILEAFYSDALALERTLQSPESMRCAEDFVHAMKAFGIEQSRVFIEKLDLFAHTGVRQTIETFIEENPHEDLPLECVTIVRTIHRGVDLADLVGRLKHQTESMIRFATRFNIEIELHLYVQALEPESAVALCEIAHSDALDAVYLFFDFEASHPEALPSALSRLCASPLLDNPKIKFGNFPFCFFPAEHFALAYRYATDDLKGYIGSQRDLIRSVQSKKNAYHKPCETCRCRAACYTYTDMAEHPEYGKHVTPRHKSALVFAGGSISKTDAPFDNDLVWTRPAEQGSLLAAVLEGFETILIIDGYFYTRFPCTTLEVMLAIEVGIHVFGAASIGALRAVELHPFGMDGMGFVYRFLKDQAIKPYHIVAQTYDEQDQPLTTPLADILYFLTCATQEGTLWEDEYTACRDVANQIHFPLLSFKAFFDQLKQTDSFTAEFIGNLESLYAEKGPASFNIKQQDALLLLQEYRSIRDMRRPQHVKAVYKRAKDRYLKALFDKYPGEPDLALAEPWKPSSEDGIIEWQGANRDHRAQPPSVTRDRARAFAENLDLIPADTTKYDPAGNFVLSTFFVPFYFMDYYPSSTTGNGEDFEEALVSAYMEFVERAPACTLHMQQSDRDEWADPEFPMQQLPQYTNWGMQEVTKQHAVLTHGYVRVTDIVAGKNRIIPKFAVMFAYSGTDGLASGNTLPEAVLYALYELIERDTCQLHLIDPELRAHLPKFQVPSEAITDARSRKLILRAQKKGCRLVLFYLPHLYGLPCVMCRVYDHNREIQCHGGIAVRSDFQAAAHAALREAYMQYITYFMGTRDDYRAFASMKRARIEYRHAKNLFFKEPAQSPRLPESRVFQHIDEELDWVIQRLTETDIEHILVANMSPLEKFKLKSVKVIIPRLELWFCPSYKPSPYFEERATRLKKMITEQKK